MFKIALMGGLLAALSFGSLNVGSLFLYVTGTGIALLILAFVLEISAAVLERLGYPLNGLRLAASERLQRTDLS